MGFGKSSDQGKANNLLQTNAAAGTTGMNNAVTQGNSALGTGMGYLRQFSNTLGAPTNYFQSMLSGNRAQSTSAIAPDIARNNDLVNGAVQSGATLTPRGGGRSSTLFNLPLQGESQTAGMFNQLRPGAANALTGIAGQQAQVGLGEGQLGQGLLGTGANFLNAGTQAANSYENAATQQRQQKAQAFKDLGNAVFGLATGGLSNIAQGIGNIATQASGGAPWGGWGGGN